MNNAEQLQRAIEAVNACRQTGDQISLPKALRQLGHLERRLGRDARRSYEEAVSIYRTQGNPTELAHSLRHLGDIYQDAGQFDLAAPCYQEALELGRKGKGVSRLDLANTIRSVALHKNSIGDVENSKSLWREARGIYLELNVKAGVAECDEWLSK